VRRAEIFFTLNSSIASSPVLRREPGLIRPAMPISLCRGFWEPAPCVHRDTGAVAGRDDPNPIGAVRCQPRSSVLAEANRLVGARLPLQVRRASRALVPGGHSEIKETKPTDLTTGCTVLLNAILDCSNSGPRLSGT
jgi:hypothetical protein